MYVSVGTVHTFFVIVPEWGGVEAGGTIADRGAKVGVTLLLFSFYSTLLLFLGYLWGTAFSN